MKSSDVCDVERRAGPLLISAPHVGTLLPDAIGARLTAPGRALVDTDWYADRLYPFAAALGATVVRARYSRYVVDLNRDPSGVSLYPGARTTGLIATETFAGEPLYAGAPPVSAETHARRAQYFDPYHQTLRRELDRIHDAHGTAMLIDAHSIWGKLPLLFEGELPDINLGTNSGRSCADAVSAAACEVVKKSAYSVVVDGRFKGGYITRQYGDPVAGVHALQIEINQRTYLADGSRTAWDERKAARLSAVLHELCAAVIAQCVAVTS